MPFQTPPNFVAGAVLTEAQLDILSENETFLANPPKVRVFHSAAQSIATATITALTFDSERLDTDTMHSTVTNPTRITATTAGTYMIGATWAFATNTTGLRGGGIRLNGTTFVSYVRHPPVAVETFLNTSALYALAAGDYVELLVEQTSGAALNAISNGNNAPEFFAVWVSL